ncbi:linoleoyl phosphatidylcholine delta-12 acetylenase [Armillaria gallica]|uniref:Linoleoyl phosphatidylcholine delta-12 acetylenase n=1 Tax=Armillaria gallica TaxID=47427 RepID=A0A2H3DLZ4_ARMGA|nr:linoleoyl phosphatidylcholine delta-12 acetylenase [Armillaria gallica]
MAPSSISFSPTSLQAKRCQPDRKKLPVFSPLPYSISEIRAAIPPEFFVFSTTRALLTLARDLITTALFFYLALRIPSLHLPAPFDIYSPLIRAAAWLGYWWFQGLVLTGVWVIGHECGHGAFSPYAWLNDLVGYTLHTLLWTPYFSWKISHHRHHMNHASMERDEVYVPKTRTDLGLPSKEQEKEHGIDWDDYFGDTPIWTLMMLIRQQVLAFPAYLLTNVSGQPDYPPYTNHFSPSSILFKPEQRNAVILSNIGIGSMVFLVSVAVRRWGWWNVIALYGIPWLEVTHWFIMITYLHHTDPVLPHYRAAQWTFARGAAATVDRPFLGWMGRWFLHDVAHYHVVHHFFPKMPYYHTAAATEHLKAFLGEHYCWSDEPIWEALWNSYNKCQFVEDEGDVLFYRDKQGQAVVRAMDEE